MNEDSMRNLPLSQADDAVAAEAGPPAALITADSAFAVDGSAGSEEAPFFVRTFAGVPISTLVLAVLLLVMAGWAAWATRELLVLRSHRIVSVSLTSLVRDFVVAEARAGGSQEQATAKVRLYLDATGAAVKSLEDQGYTVLVSEAVLGHAVPDVTMQLKTAVDAKVHDLVSAPLPVSPTVAATPPMPAPSAAPMQVPTAGYPPVGSQVPAQSPFAMTAPVTGGPDGQ